MFFRMKKKSEHISMGTYRADKMEEQQMCLQFSPDTVGKLRMMN